MIDDIRIMSEDEMTATVLDAEEAKVQLKDWLKTVIIEELLPMYREGLIDGQLHSMSSEVDINDAVYDVCVDIIDAAIELRQEY